MDISDVKEMKKHLEETIEGLINSFNTETGAKIERIDLMYQTITIGGDQQVFIEIDTKL